MFVKTTRRRRGDKSYEYLSLVEAERVDGKVGHRTLLRLGEVTALRETGQLDRIIAALRAHAERRWADLEEASVESAPSVGAVAAVRTLWERLGLEAHFDAVGRRRRLSYALGDAVFAMVANRLSDPCSKRRLPEWLAADVSMPAGFVAPALDQLYWALDQVEAAKAETETQLYVRLTDLTNLDLRLVCYDLTSSYFEGGVAPSGRFPSRAFGFSRDHRSDRPQIAIGLLTTSDGIPIAHHVFAGNTSDVTTLPGVLTDLRERFGVGGICVVAASSPPRTSKPFPHKGSPMCWPLACTGTRSAPRPWRRRRDRRRSGCRCPTPTAPPATWSSKAVATWWWPASSATTVTRRARPSWWSARRRDCGPSSGGCGPAS